MANSTFNSNENAASNVVLFAKPVPKQSPKKDLLKCALCGRDSKDTGRLFDFKIFGYPDHHLCQECAGLGPVPELSPYFKHLAREKRICPECLTGTLFVEQTPIPGEHVAVERCVSCSYFQVLIEPGY